MTRRTSIKEATMAWMETPKSRRRMLIGGAGVLAGAAAATVLNPFTAQAQQSTDTTAWYVLVNRNSGKALDVNSASTADGASVVQWTRTNANNQQFQFVDSGGGYYRIKARHSGKVLDVSSWSTADGAAIHQWTDRGGANQQFRLADSDSGYVRLINRNSNKAVEVQNAATNDGANVVQYSDWGGNNQQWQLVRSTAASGTCTLPSTYRWTSTGPLANPKAGWVSLKDFTSVVYNGQHIVYATTHNTLAGDEGAGIDDLQPLHELVRHGHRHPEHDVLRCHRADAVLLRPEEHLGARLPVGLAVQLLLPHLERPHQPQRLVPAAGAVHGHPPRPGAPIDQTLIADDTNMYLFFADDGGSIYRASMPIGNFPGSFGRRTRRS